jgi:hypothetical protein
MVIYICLVISINGYTQIWSGFHLQKPNPWITKLQSIEVQKYRLEEWEIATIIMEVLYSLQMNEVIINNGRFLLECCTSEGKRKRLEFLPPALQEQKTYIYTTSCNDHCRIHIPKNLFTVRMPVGHTDITVPINSSKRNSLSLFAKYFL